MVKSQNTLDKVNILFLCTGNSCRSQMAEGLARHFRGSKIEASSAGTKPQRLNLHAVRVMNEIGIDISAHRSKKVEELGDKLFDYVITVCDEASENCPFWPGRGVVVHRGFDDPPRLASNAVSEEEALESYRRVRDEIKDYVLTLPDCLPVRK